MSLEFFDRYEKTLLRFQDKVDSFDDILEKNNIHPDTLLEQYEEKTSKYLREKVYPFFDEKAIDYGSSIFEYCQDIEEQIEHTRDSFIAQHYDECLEEYNEYLKEKEIFKRAPKQILDLLKHNNPMKQADLINSFPKDEQSVVRKCLKKLLAKGRIVRGKKDLSKKGLWYLSFVK